MDTMDQPDIPLMLRVKEGDTQAFAALHEQYQQKVLGFFYGLSGNTQTANDLAQETFLRVWQVRKRYCATGPFPAYLFAIARMIWHEQQRRDQKVWRLGLRTPLEGGIDLPAPESDGPGNSASRDEIAGMLFRALESLPEEQRLVFVLRHVRGLSLPEIAGALDCPINTVRSRKILAVKKLRQLLTPCLRPELQHLAKEH